MSAIRAPRWVLSFTDLCLVLLAFFVLLHARAGDQAQVAQSMRAAFGESHAPATSRSYPADRLFEPGEAVLRDEARIRFEALGRSASGVVRVASHGMDRATNRLDAWELAAARVAAVARALRSGGVPEERIEVVMPKLEGQPTGQRISLITK